MHRQRSFDLDDAAAGGALVRESEDKVRLTLGAPKTPLWPAPDAAIDAARLFLDVREGSNRAGQYPRQ
jgi:hypothetical protein